MGTALPYYSNQNFIFKKKLKKTWKLLCISEFPKCLSFNKILILNCKF